MARNCGCAGGSCGCLIEAGEGVAISGLGTAADPYVVSSAIGVLFDVITFTDSSSVNFTVTGSGTTGDPMNVTAVTIAQRFVNYPTGGRPSAVAAGAGAYYYDTTLGKPAWSNGTVWKDAAGTTI